MGLRFKQDLANYPNRSSKMAKNKVEQCCPEAAANDPTATADVSEPVKSPENDVS
jgi:hypothetical protein